MSDASFMEKLLDGVEVEWKALGEVLDYEQPTKYIVSKAKYSDDFKMPVLTAGKSFILGYTDEKDGVYKANKNNAVIIFDDFTTAFHWVDFEFKVKSSAMKMIRPKQNSEADFRFVYFAMRCIGYQPQDHARHWISKYSKFKIPIPPLNIQAEIVRILDAFTALTAELTAELTARKKQYNYYRDQLLTFEEGEVEWKPLIKIAKIKNGKDWKKLGAGDIPVYGSGGVMRYVDTFAYDKPTVLIPRKGSITNIFYVESPFWNVDTIYYTEIDTTQIMPKFFYYYMKTIDLMKLDTGAGRPSLTQAILNEIEIPLPSPAEQTHIVATLDKFDTLTNSISEGLPREIKLRQQQYEYYRDLLLNFPKTEGEAPAGDKS